MSGFIDLHVHFVPGVDDGVRDREEAIAVLKGLASVGYGKLVSTPHIRAGMFDNSKPGLSSAFDAFARTLDPADSLPAIGLSAEHHCDELLLELLADEALLPYPGGHALLIEFPYEMLPVRIEHVAFKLALKRMRPVVAHPERCTPLFRSTEPIAGLLDQEVGFQLDLMSLVGKYGRRVKATAERMLEEGVYLIAATDAHSPEDVPRVGKAIDTLFKRVGDEEALVLIRENPARLLAGEATL